MGAAGSLVGPAVVGSLVGPASGVALGSASVVGSVVARAREGSLEELGSLLGRPSEEATESEVAVESVEESGFELIH